MASANAVLGVMIALLIGCAIGGLPVEFTIVVAILTIVYLPFWVWTAK